MSTQDAKQKKKKKTQSGSPQFFTQQLIDGTDIYFYCFIVIWKYTFFVLTFTR